MHYDHDTIEKKWQKRWLDAQAFRTEDNSAKEKLYVLDMFPYPSGEGLHVGHPKGYIATDVYSRHMRMKGKNVLHPMGWDAFGLPAENYALKNKVHPRVAVEKNIENFKAQLAHIGFDYDWSREINTTDPEYYKWTQWIFLQLYKKGLAYQSNEPINWCPSCMTGLANEDLDAGVCERCGTPVEKRTLPQWVLKITAYADRMLQDLDTLNWPEHIKEAQRNWIGRSEGAEIEFEVAGSEEKIKVFTTRPDTLYGATYLVLAPEHSLVEKLSEKISNIDEVKAYAKLAQSKTEIERTKEEKDKTGVQLKGITAINLVSKEEIPVYIADYVLGGYGTGAIMAVPAHDARDFAFAKKFNLPIRQVIEPMLMQTSGSSSFKADEPFVEHKGVIVLLKHWSEEKYLALGWKQAPDWGTLLTGSIEEGMSPEDTVLKEILEETGYKNARIAKPLGKIHGKYFHVPKNANRLGHADAFYVELVDDARAPVEAEEEQKHVLKWLTLGEMKQFLTPLSHQTAVEIFEKGMYTGTGILTGSDAYNGLETEDAKKKITEAVGGRMISTYKIKDWVFSRQRYWGEPIPIIHCAKDGAVAVPERDLPVLLPEVEHYEPSGTGESPLAAITDWVNTTCPVCGGPAKRETNTMPQWAGSSWYYLRFMDPHNTEALVGKDTEKYWAPVDVYVGGDHAVRHLIYARFWHKFLYDIGSVSTIEPFARLEFLGFILAEDGRKMSKRYGNVINPTDVVKTYGADAFRIYEMFMGPFENTVAWSTASIAGTTRFVERIWRLGTSGHVSASAGSATDMSESPQATTAKPVAEPADVRGFAAGALEPILHQTIKKVSEDIEAFKFNTAISQMMVLLNALEKEESIDTVTWEAFLKLLSPFAPHIASELWEMAGHSEDIVHAAWPQYEDAKLQANTIKIAVQVGGKMRGTILLSPAATQEKALEAAVADPSIAKWLPESAGLEALQKGISGVKVVYVPGRILNIVVHTGA